MKFVGFIAFFIILWLIGVQKEIEDKKRRKEEEQRREERREEQQRQEQHERQRREENQRNQNQQNNARIPTALTRLESLRLLGFGFLETPNKDQVESAFRRKAKNAHPG